ncbi:hypothetical protein [Rubinisphaera margarita]|uniref:hypothetical protein n=1 Tax=Rubinisphaera margarita TaxID=2909586 RepID=UPI001EE87BC8|nr:hypothetical protein [Rubinisphaera margarita]MCG6156392.1 hypothetical protein [Rubinisphaera margarita]
MDSSDPVAPADAIELSLVDGLEGSQPFDPPEGFDHGPEFKESPPRSIPRFLKWGSYASRRRNSLLAVLVSAFYCFLLARLSFIHELSFYILPLGYLDLLGAGLLLVAGIMTLKYMFGRGLYRYVRDGIPVTGRILKIERISGGDIPYVFLIQVEVEYRDPETQEIQRATLPLEPPLTSSVHFDAAGQPEVKDALELTFAPGDYVTLVGLPDGPFEKTLRIYGLLGLDPDREFALKNGRPNRGMQPYHVVAVISFIMLLFGLLLGVIYVVEFYWPVGGNWTIAIVPAVIGAIGGLIFGGLWAFGSRPEIQASGLIDRIALAAGCGLFATLLALEVVFLSNAMLDRSESQFEPVQIVDFWQTTHSFLFRDYSIEYRPLNGGEAEKIPSDVHTMSQFLAPWGAIEISDGYWGLRWRRGIRPVVWKQERVAEMDPDRHLFVADTNREGGKPMFLVMTPHLGLPDGTLVKAPDLLVEQVITQERLNDRRGQN